MALPFRGSCGAELVYSEALFRVEVPEPISARVDRPINVATACPCS